MTKLFSSHDIIPSSRDKLIFKLTEGAWEQAHIGHLKMADEDLEGLIQ